jgi:signal transduction histidine kinase
VAGHGFAVIAMQAGVALRVLDRDPAAAREALAGIRDASRDALAGLRAEVDALRSGEPAGSGGRDGEPAGPATAPRRPRSGLSDLPALTERIRSTGLPVTLELPPSTVEISVEVDHTAYRIVQEALTNVLRHAGPEASATVAARAHGASLMVSVRDTGRGGTASPGQGIEGMRHRAASVGGTVTAGPAPEGGFVVEASLPLDAADGGA